MGQFPFRRERTVLTRFRRHPGSFLNRIGPKFVHRNSHRQRWSLNGRNRSATLRWRWRLSRACIKGAYELCSYTTERFATIVLSVTLLRAIHPTTPVASGLTNRSSCVAGRSFGIYISEIASYNPFERFDRYYYSDNRGISNV